MSARNGTGAARVALVTGGAGFVGTALTSRLVRDGRRVRVVDSLARGGSERNLRWLAQTYGDRIEVQIGDVRDPLAVRRAVSGADQVFHLAAQVAVTTSLEDPQTDLAVNVLGTVNVLEELRHAAAAAPMISTSTNKVYGALTDLALERDEDRWQPVDETCARGGSTGAVHSTSARPTGARRARRTSMSSTTRTSSASRRPCSA